MMAQPRPVNVSDILPRQRQNWMGNEVLRVLQHIWSKESPPTGEDLVAAFQAAKKDGERQEAQRQYPYASASFWLAWSIAKVFPALVTMEDMREVLVSLAKVSLGINDPRTAFAAANECICRNPNFPKAYKVMSDVGRMFPDPSLAAHALLDGMVKCSLQQDEFVDFITTACQQIVLISTSTETTSTYALRLPEILPQLPDALETWNKVLQRLYDDRAFAALALVTSGLTDKHVTTCLDHAAGNAAVDCRRMDVENVLNCITKQQAQDWGSDLSVFIIDHGGKVGKKSTALFALHLVHLAVKTGCSKVIGRVLQKKNWQVKRDINHTDSTGNTALHVAAASTSGALQEELVSLLLANGACSYIADKDGKLPQDYVTQRSPVYNKLNQSHTFESVKARGNNAHKKRKFAEAVTAYKEALAQLSREKCSSHHGKDRAVLHCNMAASYMSMNKRAEARENAEKSIKEDSTYFKAYFRLGKILVMEHKLRDACEKFCTGLFCPSTRAAEKVDFLVEIALLLPQLPDDDSILKRVNAQLKESWSKVLDALCKKNAWDALRFLVLGPPYSNAQDRTDEWRFSDQYTTDGRIRVGYAMNFDLRTTVSLSLSDIIEEVKGHSGALLRVYATDLVLALLLQGAEIVGASSESRYHAALRLCCLTGKLGLMRYMLSEESRLKEARRAVDKEGKTLLHLACELDKKSSKIREEAIQLLLEKRFDPATKDNAGNQPRLGPHPSSAQFSRADSSKTDAPPSPTRHHQQAASGSESQPTTKQRSSPKASSCSCSKLMGAAKKSFKSKNPDIPEAFGKLVEVLACKQSPRHEGHLDLDQGAMDLLVTNLTTVCLEKGVPKAILKLPEHRLQQTIQMMVEYRKWGALKVFLGQMEDPEKSLASKVTVKTHICSKTAPTFPEKEVFRLLLDHGAKLPPDDHHSVVQAALDTRQIDLLEVLLLEQKLDPKLLSAKKDCKDCKKASKDCQDGERSPLCENCKKLSPAHAAFEIVLKGIGNFTLFDNLRVRYDAQGKDENGNTFLHLALKAIDSIHSREALGHLVQLGLVHNDWNDAKHMAVDYLKKSSDRRAEILMDHFISGIATIREEDLDRAKTRRDRWLEGNKTAKPKPMSDQSRQGADKEEKAKEEASNAQPVPSANKQKDTKVEEEDDTKFEGLLWEVVITEDVHRKLNSKKVPPHTRKKIINIIKQLASGETRRKDFRELSNAKPIRLYEANITRGERLIYEIAPDFSPTQKVYTDVIRVWDIVLDHDKIFESVSRIKGSHKRGEGCQSQVKLKVLPHAPGSDSSLERPRRYTKVDEDQESDTTVYPPASADETEYQILKFFTLTSNMELTCLEKVDVKTDFLFRVTEREYDIIELSTGAPILLIGRSGTGKTTCCLYRLMIYFLKYWTEAMTNDFQPQLTFREYESEEDHDEAGCRESENVEGREGPSEPDSEDMLAEEHKGACGGVQNESESSQSPLLDTSPTWEEKQRERGKTADASGRRMTLITEKVHLHQMFVTKNPVLCEAVQKNFRELCHAEPVAKHHTAIEERPLPHRLQDMDEYQYPLFLTLWKLILMLDASLPGPHFFKRNKDGSLCVLLPKEASAINDLHGYRSEEESESEEDEEEDKQTSTPRSPDRQQALKADPRRRVSYELFAEEIWPRMIKGVKVEYHPSLVWMEIMSFIKGSLQAVTSPNGFLDFKSYDNVGRKQAPNFVGDRQQIYDLFEKYKNYIQRKDMYDDADLLFHIFKRLRKVSLQQSHQTDPDSERQLPEWVIHEIYVDETQDFTQAELFLLICLTDQPNRMFLTGDTAQSIMRGVAFRFTDLKTLFYHAREMKVLAEHTQLQVPRDVYQLTQNYRSHDGILRMASGILDLLYEFFPESFDRLARDRGLFGGPKPALIESASPADLVTFLAGNQRQTSHIEFGAHQAVLVVNDEALKDLPKEMSKGVRLTIYEAKGLEFDDVLLYNFFKDSQASKKEWQVVLSRIEKLCKETSEEHAEQKSAAASGLVRIDEDALRQRGAETRNFDEKKHKILNSELKHLYTAVTRARANVYIFDQDEEKRKPMFQYFLHREHAEVKNNLYSAGGTARGSFAKKSSPKEWVKRGDDFMRRELYSIAADCYSNAGNDFLRNIAVAHARKSTASVMQPPSRALDDATKTAYQKAAILFLECQRDSQKQKQPPEQWYYLATEGAGRCLEKGGKHVRAAQVYEKSRKLREAAWQYEKAEKWESASKCHEEMLDYHRALTCLVRGSLYDLALKCLQRFHNMVKKYQNSKKLLPKALVKPGTEFTDENLRLKKAKACKEGGHKDDMLQALEGLEPEEQINFLEKNSCFELAAEKMLEKGARSDAVLMLLHNGMIEKAIEHAGKSQDVSLKAQCYLHKARILLQGDGGSEKDSSRSGLDSPQDSVPDTWDKDLGEAERLLGEALNIFKKHGMQNEAGECLLLTAQLPRRKRFAFEALKNFQPEGRAPNFAGVLECYQELYQPEVSEENVQLDITRQQLLEGVDYSSELVRLLLDEEHHSNPQFRQCLHFFGFEMPDASSLTFYPCLRPRWLAITDKKYKANAEKLSGQEMEQALRKLARFLAERAMTWYRAVRDAVEKEMKEAEQDQELLGRSTVHIQNHTRRLVRLYAESVWLDHSADGLAKCSAEISREVFNKSFASVERLLKFLLPAELPRYHTNTVYGFCCQVQEGRTRMYRKIHDQIGHYLHYLRTSAPESQGQGQDKSRSPGEERNLQKHCRTTKFIVRASLLSTLFGHRGLADVFCSDLELQLSKIPESEAKRWMKKTTEYAVWTDKKLETRMHLARRYLEAVSYLLGLNTKDSSEPFNPTEALVKFTQFIKLIGDRKQIHQMPDTRLSLFWIEIFTTLALFLVDKCKGGRTYSALPACYFRSLHMLNLVEPGGQETLQQWLQKYNLGKFSLTLVLERMQYLTRFLCGDRPGDFSLLDQLSTQARSSMDAAQFSQLERALFVSLVLLLNYRIAEVSEKQQVPILRAVKKLCENTQGMPDHLKALVESVREAKDYSHIFKALAVALESMGENLRFYRWHWKERSPMPPVEGKATIPNGPLPSLEAVQAKQKAAEVRPEASESKQDGTQQAAQATDTEENTAGDTQGEEEEEEEMVSAEDIAKHKERLHQSRIASNSISHWREFVKKQKEKRASRDRDLDIMALFSRKPVTETNCAICGQSYEQVFAGETEPKAEDFLEDEEMAAAVSAAKSPTPRERHETSWEHQQKEMEYKRFYEACETQIARYLSEIGGFFSKIQIEEHAEIYSDHPHELLSYDRYKKVRQAVQNAIAHQKWEEEETLSLCKQVEELESLFKDRKVETIFLPIFNKFQSSQKKKTEQEEPLSLRNVADFLRHEGGTLTAGAVQQVTKAEATPL